MKRTKEEENYSEDCQDKSRRRMLLSWWSEVVLK